MPNEYINIINLINSGIIYLWGIISFLFFYSIIGLLTWSLIKPLKYMGISNIIVGIMLIILRLLPYSISVLIGNNLLERILPEIIKPIFISGICVLVLGILMILLYKFIDKRKRTV